MIKELFYKCVVNAKISRFLSNAKKTRTKWRSVTFLGFFSPAACSLPPPLTASVAMWQPAVSCVRKEENLWLEEYRVKRIRTLCQFSEKKSQKWVLGDPNRIRKEFSWVRNYKEPKLGRVQQSGGREFYQERTRKLIARKVLWKIAEKEAWLIENGIDLGIRWNPVTS